MLVEMRAITKRFGPVVANDRVDFDIAPGEVHALLGENGAGKSTLMSILSGLYQPDSGEIRIDGRTVRFSSPRDAIRAGIGMVHQHFKLVATFTVAENVALGLDELPFRLDLGQLERQVSELGRQYGLHVDPGARIWQLSVGEQQRVEILKALYRGARILCLDEPTAVLTPQEASELFRTLRAMARRGHGVVMITHKLREVMEVADRITVMRGGRAVGTFSRDQVDEHTLAERMVGREVSLTITKEPVEPGPVVLEVFDLSARGDRGHVALTGVSFQVRAGEVLGIAGVAGNGQRELAEVLSGLRPALSGRIALRGQDVTRWPPRAIAGAGLRLIPEDRLGMGLVPGLDVADNVILRDYDRPPISQGLWLSRKEAMALAERLVREFDVRGGALDRPVWQLSGGNAQKLLLARELASDPDVILAVHPTRGLDVAATRAVHRLLLDARLRGKAVLLISEDLDELLELSDRIAVLYGGRVMGIVPAEPGQLATIGLMMAGREREVAAQWV